MSFKLVDTHCHLSFEPLFSNLENIISNAKNSNVNKIIVPAYDIDSFNKIKSIISIKNIYGAFGIHPWVSFEYNKGLNIEKYYSDVNVVAIGEIGLDYAIDNFNMDEQKNILKKQIELAIELKKPVILHCRKAFDDILSILKYYSPNVKGVIHAYSRGPELAKEFIKLGLHIGFGGAITRPKAKRARRSAKSIDLEYVVLETDAPSIGLDNVNPEETEPKHIFNIAKSLVEIKKIDMNQLASIIENNVTELFGI